MLAPVHSTFRSKVLSGRCYLLMLTMIGLTPKPTWSGASCKNDVSFNQHWYEINSVVINTSRSIDVQPSGSHDEVMMPGLGH